MSPMIPDAPDRLITPAPVVSASPIALANDAASIGPMREAKAPVSAATKADRSSIGSPGGMKPGPSGVLRAIGRGFSVTGKVSTKSFDSSVLPKTSVPSNLTQ